MAPIRRSRIIVLLVLAALAFYMLKPRGGASDTRGRNRLRHLNKDFNPAEFEAAADAVANPHKRLGLELIPVDPNAPFDAEVAWHNILNQSPFAPVIIVSKSYCPHSSRAKKILLEKYDINPAPFVLELDKHPNGAELQAHIAKVSDRRTVPNVFVLHKTRGGGDEMAHLDLANSLLSTFRGWSNGLFTIEKRAKPALD